MTPDNRREQGRAPNGRFAAGKSGNPGGRPKGTGEVRELARRHTEAAIAALVDIMQNGKSKAARIAAAIALLDRGHGKPTLPVAGADERRPIVFRVSKTDMML